MDETDIPIDIHYNKLLDWLLNRRHCKQQWASSALEVREKINTAIQDMPPVDEITKLLQGTYINYFHCKKIVELLKKTDDGSKNIFGRYSSQRMKDWMDIINLYEKDGVYLAEAAQMLMRNVNYEIPALKRQIAKCQQTQNDCARKEGEYASSSAELKEKYSVSCQQIGINGKKIKTELLSLVEDLPVTYERLSAASKDLQPACQYYVDFVSFLLDSASENIPLLQYLIKHGNKTTYEWRCGKVPSSVEEPKMDYKVDDDEDDVTEKQEEIDWGDLGTTDDINFDISLDDQGADIDWGDQETSAAIDIEVVDTSTIEATASQDDGVARGSDALTLLDNPETRSVLINELLELQAFLTQRQQELSDDSNIACSNQLSSAPRNVQTGTQEVSRMLGGVSALVDQITSKKMQDLFLIRSSPRYVERIAEQLKKTLQDSDKMMSLSRLMVIRQQEAQVEAKEMQPKVDLIRARTKELQKQIENEISKKYKDRRVNIMGEINTV